MALRPLPEQYQRYDLDTRARIDALPPGTRGFANVNAPFQAGNGGARHRASAGRAEAPYAALSGFDAAAVGESLPPPRRWIVEDWLPVGRVTLCYGDGGTGKTTASQMLMTACAVGGSWLGMPVEKCRSVALLSEDDAGEIHYRQRQINDGLRIRMADIGPTDWFAGIGQDNTLMTFDRDGIGTTTRRYDDLMQTATNNGARLVVIDAIASTFAGNEIDRNQVTQFVQALTRMAMEIDGAVLLLGHPSKSGMAAGGSKDSGSTAWNASVRSRWSFSRPAPDEGKGEDARVLAREKSNWSRRGDRINMQWSSGVFVPEGATATDTGAGIVANLAENKFTELLKWFTDRGRGVSDSKNAGTYAPKVFSKHPSASGINKRQFEIAMENLFVKGVIDIETYGRPSAPSKRLAFSKAAETAPDNATAS